VAPAFDDGGVVGSRIALFGCPASEALETIGQIELAEGLPHPFIDGEWAKISPEATASYLIIDFGETTLDAALELTRQAGLRYLYHGGPFRTWGHFELRPDHSRTAGRASNAVSNALRKRGCPTGRAHALEFHHAQRSLRHPDRIRDSPAWAPPRLTAAVDPSKPRFRWPSPSGSTR
jgi:hypothetical protein